MKLATSTETVHIKKKKAGIPRGGGMRGNKCGLSKRPDAVTQQVFGDFGVFKIDVAGKFAVPVGMTKIEIGRAGINFYAGRKVLESL